MARQKNKTNDREDVSTTISELLNQPLNHLTIDLDTGKNDLLEEGICYILKKYGGAKEKKAIEKYKEEYEREFDLE